MSPNPQQPVQSVQSPPPALFTNQPQPQKKKKTWLIVAAVIVVVIVVIAAIAVAGYVENNKYSATVYIHVTSSHISNTVTITLFANGDEIKTDTLQALYENTYEYHATFGDSSTTLTISGTGSGGGLGDTSDSSSITISDGQTYNVYLTL